MGEIKKGKYVYYHCTGNKGGDCKRKYIKEEVIEESFLGLLEQITLPEKFAQEATDMVKTIRDEHKYYVENELKELEKQSATLRNRINKIFDM